MAGRRVGVSPLDQRNAAGAGGAGGAASNGKTNRRPGKADGATLHLASAFPAGAKLVLGQTARAAKSNEKTAVLERLATLALEACIVTIDTMGAQPSIAQAIRARTAGPWSIACAGAWMWPSPMIRCARTAHAAHNLSVLKQITLNFIHIDPIARRSGIKVCRLIAATSDTYRAHLLGLP